MSNLDVAINGFVNVKAIKKCYFACKLCTVVFDSSTLHVNFTFSEYANT